MIQESEDCLVAISSGGQGLWYTSGGIDLG